MALWSAKFAEKLLQSRRGSIAIQLGLLLVAVIGMVTLGTEITFLLFKHRQMQSVADAAALGAATALGTGNPADFRLEARAIAASAGFVNGSDGVTVTVNYPPVVPEGTHVGDTNAVEVIVSQPQTLGLVTLFRPGEFNVGARSVATLGRPGSYCVLALDPSAPQAIRLQNNAIVTNRNCGVAANSSSSSALDLRNNAEIRGPVSVVGNWSLANNARLTGKPLINNGPVIADPYADVRLQPIPSCTGQSGTGQNNITRNLTPGHFCNGWDFKNNVTLNLASGTYYIDQRLSLKNNVVLNGASGVTIVVNGNYEVDFSNNARINITAPSTGDYAGLAFFGTRSGDTSATQVFSNNTVMNIKGAVYFPSQTIEFDNNGSTMPNGCTQVIGRLIRMSNNVELDNHCEGTGVQPIGGSALSQLVE
jgi:Flp pilus assembly protein TadG